MEQKVWNPKNQLTPQVLFCADEKPAWGSVCVRSVVHSQFQVPLEMFSEMFQVWSECFSRNMDTRPSFSLQFLIQFWKLHLIFYSNQLSIFVFFLFIGSSCLYTFLGYRVGLISGEIDNEIRFFIEHSSTMSRKFLQSFSGSRPWPVFADMSFKHGTRCGNIDHKVRLEDQKQQLYITCLRSGKNFLARRLMVLWRRSLTSYMQKLYIHGHNFYKVEKLEQFIPSPRFHCQLCEGGGEIDNPDQRLTSDVSSMLTSYERLMEDDLFILPASTAYYAYKVQDQEVFQHSTILSRRTVRPRGSGPLECSGSSFYPSSTSSW